MSPDEQQHTWSRTTVLTPLLPTLFLLIGNAIFNFFRCKWAIFCRTWVEEILYKSFPISSQSSLLHQLSNGSSNLASCHNLPSDLTLPLAISAVWVSHGKCPWVSTSSSEIWVDLYLPQHHTEGGMRWGLSISTVPPFSNWRFIGLSDWMGLKRKEVVAIDTQVVLLFSVHSP